jgi:hypothetical protein
MSRAKIGDAGKYKTEDSNIVEKYPEDRPMSKNGRGKISE